MYTFDELKKEVDKAHDLEMSAYKSWKKAQEHATNLRKTLSEICDHSWKIDHTSCDPNHTCWMCTKCGITN